MIGELYVDIPNIVSILSIIVCISLTVYIYYELTVLKSRIDKLEKGEIINKEDTNVKDNIKVSHNFVNSMQELYKDDTIHNNTINNYTTERQEDTMIIEDEINEDTMNEFLKKQLDEESEIIEEDSNINETIQEVESDDQIIMMNNGSEIIEDDIIINDSDDLNDDTIQITKEGDYESMTVNQLKKILVEKNLPVSGNKTKLIERLNN